MAIAHAELDRATFGESRSTVLTLVAVGVGWQFTLKQAADRAVALVALLLLSPLLLAIALGVRLSSIGPVIFRQRRVGRDGETFVLFKFRTMVEDSGVAGFTLAHGTAPGGIEGADRRTAVGRWLRAISLDELPQLVNVLRGDMSLIGPRPERPEYVELFARLVPGYTERHRVKSGITGWAQAHGLRGQTSIADRVEFDNYYIENWSLALDLRILALTVVELLRFRDGRPDSLRDRCSQRTGVPSVCLAVRVGVQLGCAGRGRQLAGAAPNNNPPSVVAFEVVALDVRRQRAVDSREARRLAEHHSARHHRAHHTCPPQDPLPSGLRLPPGRRRQRRARCQQGT
jgi:lipopolysaccharide/colanic/teichoic acid biosynthesis glycosyltransferase